MTQQRVSHSAKDIAPETPPALLQIVQLDTPEKQQHFAMGCQKLLAQYETILLDDTSRYGVAAGMEADLLLENTLSLAPWLWILIDVQSAQAYAKGKRSQTKGIAQPDHHFPVWAIAGLSDILMPVHATLHGVSHSAMRRHPAIKAIAWHVFHEAFHTLGLKKLNAVFETSNRGALGFCWQHGFVREYQYPKQTRFNGEPVDVNHYVLYSDTLRKQRNSDTNKIDLPQQNS